MISELSATPFPAPTLLSTVIPPKTLVPVELKFGSKRGLVGVVPEQRVLGDKILVGEGVLPAGTGERSFNLMVYVCNSTDKDVLLPAGTPFYAYFGEKKYMNLPKSMGRVVPGKTLAEQAQNCHVADINAMQSEFQEEQRAGIIIQNPGENHPESELINESDFVNMIMSAEVCPSFQDMIFKETDKGMMVGFKPHSTSELSKENKRDVINDVSDVGDVMHDGFNNNKVRTYAQVT